MLGDKQEALAMRHHPLPELAWWMSSHASARDGAGGSCFNTGVHLQPFKHPGLPREVWSPTTRTPVHHKLTILHTQTLYAIHAVPRQHARGPTDLHACVLITVAVSSTPTETLPNAAQLGKAACVCQQLSGLHLIGLLPCAPPSLRQHNQRRPWAWLRTSTGQDLPAQHAHMCMWSAALILNVPCTMWALQSSMLSNFVDWHRMCMCPGRIEAVSLGPQAPTSLSRNSVIPDVCMVTEVTTI